MSLYLGGSANHNSELDLILQDNLNSMGSAVTKNIGSLAWCEAYALAKTQMASLNFIRLISNQFVPATLSVYARRLAAIYNIPATGNNPIPDNLAQIQTQIGLVNALFGTPNSLVNVEQYIKATIGQCFIDLEFNGELQAPIAGAPLVYPTLATPQNETIPLSAGQLWFSPLSILYVRVWQPRDNKDNLQMPTNIFLNTVDSYSNFVNEWIPATSVAVNMQLLYFGNDGYGINGSGVQGNMADGYSPYGSFNTVSATAGTNTITGNGATLFLTDLYGVNNYKFLMPIEIVDDLGVLQTYHITNVASNSVITTKETISNNISSRSYRLLGVECDTNYMADSALCHQ